jgi:hypothetical protein
MNKRTILKRELPFIRFLPWLGESELSQDTRKDTFVLLGSELHWVPPGAAWSAWEIAREIADCTLLKI